MTDSTHLAQAEALVRTVTKPREPLRLIRRTTGRSGAQSYEVLSGSRRFMLKVDAPDRPDAHWQQSLRIQRAAAARGVTPPVLAADHATRSVLTDHVVDVSFLRAVLDPNRTDAVLDSLAQSIAVLHSLDPQSFAAHTSPLQQCRDMLARVAIRFDVPDFAERAWHDLLDQDPVFDHDALCHLDLNPTNILFDGSKVWLVDWDTAGPGDRWLDVATVTNMLLFDAGRTLSWLQRYADFAGMAPPDEQTFAQARRVSYVAYGCAFLDLVRHLPESTTGQLSLSECYAAMSHGELDIDADSGRWQLAAAYFSAYWDVA